MRVDANDYSVHPSAVGRRVDVVASPDQVLVSCAGRPVAEHARCWAAHQTITDAAHRQAAAALRATSHPRPISPLTNEVQHRRLADYDEAFGLGPDEAVA